MLVLIITLLSYVSRSSYHLVWSSITISKIQSIEKMHAFQNAKKTVMLLCGIKWVRHWEQLLWFFCFMYAEAIRTGIYKEYFLKITTTCFKEVEDENKVNFYLNIYIWNKTMINVSAVTPWKKILLLHEIQ